MSTRVKKFADKICSWLNAHNLALAVVLATAHVLLALVHSWESGPFAP